MLRLLRLVWRLPVAQRQQRPKSNSEGQDDASWPVLFGCRHLLDAGRASLPLTPDLTAGKILIINGQFAFTMVPAGPVRSGAQRAAQTPHGPHGPAYASASLPCHAALQV